ncbi:MAG: hypothetical protein M1825_001668 [Sarcosagium campestre]|nr:MAG: hypothetical protein M1825_001668 [Sarcosagium campestre]
MSRSYPDPPDQYRGRAIEVKQWIESVLLATEMPLSEVKEIARHFWMPAHLLFAQDKEFFEQSMGTGSGMLAWTLLQEQIRGQTQQFETEEPKQSDRAATARAIWKFCKVKPIVYLKIVAALASMGGFAWLSGKNQYAFAGALAAVAFVLEVCRWARGLPFVVRQAWIPAVLKRT